MWTELRTVVSVLREQRRYATFTREALEADKLVRFRQLVAHANRHSPYYATAIKDRGIQIDRCVPTDFPVLTKPMLMSNFDSIVTDRRVTKQGIADFLSRSTDPNDLLLDCYRVLHTSGTSGEMGFFIYSPSDWIRGMFSPGRRQGRMKPKGEFGRFRFAFYGATGGHFAGVTIAKSAERGLFRLFMKLGVFEVNNPLPEVIAQLNEFRPHMLFGYTNALKVLAERQRTGELRIAPLGVSAGGETVTDMDRAMLKDAFNCEVTSTYACTEHLMMGASDLDGDHMTLYDDNLIYELFDDHSLVTNLFNTTLPLIRYRMGDILQPVPCPAGSRHLCIRNLVGRTELVPLFLNEDGVEDFISPHTINEVFVAGVTRFQLQITSASSFTFLACLDSALDAAARAKAIAALEARLREILAQKRMGSVQFTIEVCDKIAADPRTRKFRLIVDRRSTNTKT
jgi:phenylacetate-coenzyme A ligase PaaK-like adenylate-forming protein